MSQENASPKPNLFYGLWPHEVAWLVLLAAAMYCSQSDFHVKYWPKFVYGAALLTAFPVLWFRCREEWRQLPNVGFFTGLALVWTALFSFLGISTLGVLGSASLFGWMFNDWTSPGTDEGHGLLVPLVVLALVWHKRKDLAAQRVALWPPGMWLVGLGLMLHYAGYEVQQQRFSVIGFFVGFYGIMGLAWGPGWLKTIFFPYFLLAFCVPLGALIIPITLPLRILAANLVAVICRLGLTLDVYCQGTRLSDSLGNFNYDVAPACSGLHSIVAILALTIIYGFVCFKTKKKRLLMVAASIPLAILDNVVRLCGLVLVATFFGQAAGSAVETDLGYFTFTGSLLCVLWLGRRLEKLDHDAPGAKPPGAAQPVTP